MYCCRYSFNAIVNCGQVPPFVNKSLRWFLILILAAFAGKLISKIKLPSILGWLIVGMIFGPHAVWLMPQELLDAQWYKIIIMWMQCAFGLMLGTELVWKKIKNYGKALVITTLTQSLGTFFFVTLVFAIAFFIGNIPVYLAFIFGGIAAKKGFELAGEIK